MHHACPTVSVIIPLYNAEAFLAEALASVLGQTLPPHQVIVVDDGSTDGSADVARRFGKQIALVQQPNAGAANARNRGVALATGDFLAFLDHDDYWAPEKLALQVAAFQQSPDREAIFGQMAQHQSITTTSPTTHWVAHQAHDGWHLDTVLIRRQAFERIGPFDSAWMIDSVEWLWRARRLGLVVQVLPAVLAWRRIHGDNYSIREQGRAQTEYLRLIRTMRAQQRGNV